MVSRSPKLQLHQTPCHSQMIQRHSHQWQDPINICLQIESLGPFDPLSPIAPQFCIFPTPSLSTKNTNHRSIKCDYKGLSKHKVIVHIEILGFMMPFFHNTFSLMQLNRHMKTTVYLTMSIMHTFGCQENCNLFIVFEKQKRFSLQLGL